jgi:AraC-like DNA-binding protein
MTEKSFPAIAVALLLIFAAMTPRASGQDAADTSVNTAAGAPVDTLVDARVNTSADTSFDASAGTPDNARADTSVNVSAGTPAGAPPDTSAGISVNTPVSAPVDTNAGTTVNTAVAPPVDTLTAAPAANVPADTSARKAAVKLTLPPYAFHILFLAVSIALIAATLRFFLTRRNDSRRFLTTTRLSVLDKLVQRGCRYIEANYPNPALTPETVCNSLVTGKAYLDALFMNELGINVQDFIIQVRVNAIKNRLSASQGEPLDINAVCAECGFADRAEAERCFAAITGGTGIAEFGRPLKTRGPL